MRPAASRAHARHEPARGHGDHGDGQPLDVDSCAGLFVTDSSAVYALSGDGQSATVTANGFTGTATAYRSASRSRPVIA